jgi:excisionase family DNA binding protein
MQEIPSNLGGSTVPDFARRWNVPVSTVWAWIAEGRLKATKLGPRATRIPLEEEQRLVSEGMR